MAAKPPMKLLSRKCASMRLGAPISAKSDLWASTWLQREDCSLIGIFWGTGLFARAGWAEIDAALRPYVEATAACGSEFLAFRHAGHRIKVIGDMACATFTETNWHISDVDRKNPMDLLEHRVLERHDGQWKIAHLIFVPVRSVAHDRAHIRVNASGGVAHISPAMRAALVGSGLTISAGRLRADRPKWDRELQAAICRTHRLTGFGEMGAAFTEGEFLDRANTREFPILLGEDDGGGQRYCMVMVQDGGVFVALDDPARIDRRLQLAKGGAACAARHCLKAREAGLYGQPTSTDGASPASTVTLLSERKSSELWRRYTPTGPGLLPRLSRAFKVRVRAAPLRLSASGVERDAQVGARGCASERRRLFERYLPRRARPRESTARAASGSGTAGEPARRDGGRGSESHRTSARTAIRVPRAVRRRPLPPSAAGRGEAERKEDSQDSTVRTADFDHALARRLTRRPEQENRLLQFPLATLRLVHPTLSKAPRAPRSDLR